VADYTDREVKAIEDMRVDLSELGAAAPALVRQIDTAIEKLTEARDALDLFGERCRVLAERAISSEPGDGNDLP